MQELVLEPKTQGNESNSQAEPERRMHPRRQKASASHTLNSPMRVVHIIKHCGYANGSVHVAVDLACVQAEAGYDVTFVSGGGTFEPLLKQYGVRVITFNHDQGKPFSMLRTAWKMAFFARRHKPDVLHAHMMSSVLVGYAASKLSGVPLVSTVHNSFDPHSFLMRLADKVVAVSLAEKDSLKSKGYNVKQLTAIMNAPSNSPREPFMRNDREVHIESPCIVSASALHRRKGVFDLINACAELFKTIPTWKLYIAGEGPDRAELEAQVHTVGIADRVVFLGFLPEPRPLLEKADIFVLVSYADPCSLAVGEARAAGCAIVASNVGGTPEMLEFGRAGRLVSPGNPVQLAAELRTLMTDDQQRLDLRKASLEGAEIFDVHRLIKDYERVYLDAGDALPSFDSGDHEYW